MTGGNYLDSVRQQYEHFPYPARDPADEKKRLQYVRIDALDSISHYCFRGKQTFGKDFRALVAGGGTGDSSTFLAAQLQKSGAQVVYVDISEASLAVARQRAEMRGLDNITFLHTSLLDLPGMKLAPFDYITCTGVLHHLADPVEGLHALKAVLKPGGGMGLMTYATYGRAPVQEVRSMLQLIHPQDEQADIKLEHAKALLARLPSSNNFRKVEKRWEHGIATGGDISLYDMFLHAQERSYTVPELYAWVEGCGLSLVDFIGNDATQGKSIYNPLYFFDQTPLWDTVLALPMRDRQALAELMLSHIRRHMFYVTSGEDTVASLEEETVYAPCITLRFAENIHATVRDKLAARPGGPLTLHTGAQAVSVAVPPLAYLLSKYIDGKRTIAEIIAATQADPALADAGLSADDIRQHFYVYYGTMHELNLMYLRHRSVAPYATVSQIHGRPA